MKTLDLRRSSIILSSEDIQKFNKNCLNEHNRLRKLHGCPKLALSQSLLNSACLHAQKLVDKHQLEHNTDLKCGQNIASLLGTPDLEEAAVNATNAWYKNSEDYEYTEESSTLKDNFTQMIWKSTKKVGFGCAIGNSGRILYVVAHYLPIGNISGKYVQNVPPPQIQNSSNKEESPKPPGCRIRPCKIL